LKFLVQLGKTPTEAFRLLQGVYGDHIMSRARLSSDTGGLRREDVEDDPRNRGLTHAGPRKMSSLSARSCMEIAA